MNDTYNAYVNILDSYQSWVTQAQVSDYRRLWMQGQLDAARHFLSKGDFTRFAIYMDCLDRINQLYESVNQ